MTVSNDAPKRSRAHTIYKLPSGERVPGVTTVLGILNKPALVKWANNLGLQGIDSNKYVDDKATIGTLAHQMVVDYYAGEKTDVSEYAPAQVEQAENCLLSFWEWEKQHKVEPIMLETPLVSELYRYGGQIDLYANLDGNPALIDFKTGNAIYPEYMHQLAAYENLLSENGYVANDVRILRIGRNNDEGFEDRKVSNLDKHFELFKHCLSIYNLKKEIKHDNV